MSNRFAEWRKLFEGGPLQVGQVSGVDGGVATITLPHGGTVRALGDASVGDHVYVRDGVIQGPAPDLPLDSADF